MLVFPLQAGGSSISNQEEHELGINYQVPGGPLILGHLSHFCCLDSLAPKEAESQEDQEPQEESSSLPDGFLEEGAPDGVLDLDL